MITGKLTDLKSNEMLGERVQKVLSVLKEIDFSEYSPGRHELEDDSFFFLNEYQTKEATECFWEAHKKYCDIHFILEGEEKIGYDHIESQKVTKAYDSEKDATFFEGDMNSMIILKPGDVMICFPEDSHMTGVVSQHPQKVRKVVLKVRN
ncbi:MULTISPECIES: YhcH/YjgK/YiaL family protein [unclassified Exiguobacterium]|uniref:YhcH/YjgK/YiaL family protein n=1 Tax=unclassified Exiguobacterium TaxID=2644629 RepID=UPI001BE589DF|nr:MULTISPECIES: YhcH/YjgK/YiaL family protein [unclassified Exiguobacterium]